MKSIYILPILLGLSILPGCDESNVKYQITTYLDGSKTTWVTKEYFICSIPNRYEFRDEKGNLVVVPANSTVINEVKTAELEK